MVAPVDLGDRVPEYRREHGHPVTDASGRTGQVHDQGTARHPGHATGEDPGRDPRPRAGPRQRARPAPTASATPGTSRSSPRLVISGVRSPGVSPVPPVVTTTS